MTKATVLFIASWIGAFLTVPASAQQTPLPAQTTPTPPVVAAPVVAAPQVQPPASTGQRPQAAHSTLTPTPTPVGRSLQAFAVTLLIADMQAGGTQDDVPAAARKALADLRDFLPYRSYRLVDAQWIRSTAGATVESRLKGVEQQEYALRVGASPPGATGLNVRFVLRESDGSVAATGTAAVAELMQRRQQLQSQLAETQKKVEMGVASARDVQAIERDLQSLTVQLEQERDRQIKARASRDETGGGAVMDAVFRMDLDETVVVGTSRIKGDKALIALLTAVGTKSPGGRD